MSQHHMSRHRRLVSVVGAAIAAVVAAGLMAAPTVAAPTPAAEERAGVRVEPIAWAKCKDPFLKAAKAKCGDLAVPLDHANPAAGTITIRVSRVKHTGRKYRGVMLTNPGGPGGSGTWMAALGQFVPGKSASSYDWVSFDPRGVGESKPALTCDGQYTKLGRPPYVPDVQSTLDAWLAKSEKYAADCGTAEAAALLPHVKTTDTIADLEILRQALGQEKVSFFGYSYGTYLGQVYATLHPDRLDKVILDSIVDPSRVWYDANLDQDYAFDKVLQRFFKWVAKDHETYGLGKTRKQVSRSYDKLLAKLTKKPVKKFGAAELTDSLLGLGYTVYAWPDAANGLAALKKGNVKPLRSAYVSGNPTGPGADNGYAMYLATECTDAAWPTDWATWQADNDVVHAKAPFMTWGNAWFNAPCRTWPAVPGTPVTIEGSTFPGKVLLIGETLDAATPFSGALAAKAEFPGASLIEGVGGTTHSASLNGISCVDKPIAKYLASGKVPARKAGNRADVKCPAIEPPTGEARTVVRRPALLWQTQRTSSGSAAPATDPDDVPASYSLIGSSSAGPSTIR